MANAFLIGPPKCGTTAIAAELNRHPKICVSTPKEPNYFFLNGGNPYGWRILPPDAGRSYMSHFTNAKNESILLDASTSYFFGDHVAEQIYRFNPQSRIIAVLRNPVYRAFSMYKYWHQESGRPISQEDFKKTFQEDALRNQSKVPGAKPIGWLRDIGFYELHLARYRQLFPAESVLVLFYMDLNRDPTAFYQSIFEFLGMASEVEEVQNAIVNETIEPRSVELHRQLNRPGDSWIGRLLKRSPLQSVLKRIRPLLNRLNRRRRSEKLRFPDHDYAELVDCYLPTIGTLESWYSRDLSGWRDGSMQ